MNLTTFTPKNCQHKKEKPVRPARITVSRLGVFSLSDQASKKIGLSVSDRVALGQDPDSPADWYIYKVGAKDDGFTLRKPTNLLGKESSILLFNSSELRRKLIDAVYPGQEGIKLKLLLGGDTKSGKITYWGLLAPAVV